MARAEVSAHRRQAERWRKETVRSRGLRDGLRSILREVSSARTLLITLRETTDLDELHDAMWACVLVEEAMPSQGWRIAWTEGAEQGFASFLQERFGVSRRSAVDVYWAAATEFTDGVATSGRDFFDLPPPTEDEENIGRLLGTGDPKTAHDALLVIHMQAFMALAEAEASPSG